MTGTLGERLEHELLNKAYGLDFQLSCFKKERNVRCQDALEWINTIIREVSQQLNRYGDQLSESQEPEFKEDKASLELDQSARALLIICENKNDVSEIVKALLVRHKHMFDYKGKVDGLLIIEDAHNRTISTQVMQVRPDDVIVGINWAGRGIEFKISNVSYFFFSPAFSCPQILQFIRNTSFSSIEMKFQFLYYFRSL